MSNWNAEYKAKVREFMAQRGSKIMVDARHSFNEFDDVSSYGYNDIDAMDHVRSAEGKYPGEGCHWIVPEGAVLYERSYSMFTDTDHSNNEEMGVNVRGCRCACGKYEDVILRWNGSVSEMLQAILGMPDLRVEVEL